MLRGLLLSSATALRQTAALRWLGSKPTNRELLLVSGSTQGALELGRLCAAERGALFGWHRLSLQHLALRLAEESLLRDGCTPASPLALEAVWTRVVSELEKDGKLGRFASLADRPGLPLSLARSVEELRLAGVDLARLDAETAAAALAFESALKEAHLVDRAGVLLRARDACRAQDPPPFARLPLLLLDVEIHTRLQHDLIEALANTTPDAFATVPKGDAKTLAHLEHALGCPPTVHEPASDGPLSRLQRNVFEVEDPPKAEASDQVRLFSAPGEMRECVEIARLIHQQAKSGVPFDQIAVLLRSPTHYRAFILEALRRAGVPTYYAGEARRPDPAGRAFLALLACADEQLSAKRFAEYLSLSEVPELKPDGAPPPASAAGELWRAVDADVDEVAPSRPEDADPEEEVDDAETNEGVDPAKAVAAGTLRVPRRWEKLLVEAAVIGGKDRWARRLDGLEAQLKAELADPTASDAERTHVQRQLQNLDALRAFALPLLKELTALQDDATWGEWLETLSVLASRTLRHPDRVLGLLSELRPMSQVGPVGLSEVRRVLSRRLRELTLPPPKRRFGRVFVGSPTAARGLSFHAVYVPGLAERIFPQRVHADPLLPDVQRSALSPELAVDADRAQDERGLLQLCVGAASESVVLSYPRLDARQSRPRVPSFYGLEAVRATEGRLLTYEELRRRAEVEGAARIGWPAPTNPDLAIDDTERDLSWLEPLLRGQATKKGAARYLVEKNPYLGQALRAHWARWHQPGWSAADGLVLKPDRLELLAKHQLSERSYSATALQHYAQCPYFFYLHAIAGLRLRDQAEAIEELDPLQRGSLVHEVLYEVMSQLRASGQLPLNESKLPEALKLVDATLERLAAQYEERYLPAIERVWVDGVELIRADLREAVRQMARTTGDWAPWKFELAFGLTGAKKREQEDPASQTEPVPLDIGLKLRGSIDLVERTPSGTLRATDYKTGKATVKADARVGGGQTLQPALYALALEKLFAGAKVDSGRLSYCTLKGGFSEVVIPLDDATRRAAQAALDVVREAVAKGQLPAAPAEGACARCDLNSVCGSHEERRVSAAQKKTPTVLTKLRGMP